MKTILSNKIFNILDNSPNALSANQIMDQLDRLDLKPNKTTIYRILDKLVNKNLASIIRLNTGISYYELAKSHHSHHHHFFCNKCQTLFCLDTCHLEQYNINLEQLLPSKKFQITDHDFNLYGICEPCAQ